MDTLQHVQQLRDTIKELRYKVMYQADCHEDREKELLHAISVANRKVKKQADQIKRRDDAIRDLKRNNA